VVKLAAGGVGTFNCHYSLPPGRQGRRQLFEVTSDGFSAYLDLGPTMTDSPYGGTGSIIDGTDELPVESYFADVAGQPHPAASSEMLNFARWLRGDAAPIAPLEYVVETVKLTEAVAAGFCGRPADFEPYFTRGNAP
jgi:hypothetical protein